MSISRPANLEETLKAYDASPMTLYEFISSINLGCLFLKHGIVDYLLNLIVSPIF